MPSEETYSDKGAVCPHCRHLNDPSDGDYELYDENTTNWTCENCEREFIVSVYKSFSWTCKA